eukprot:scaffold39167_cov155-Skeletonema_dohrnii-CCMP3373.AAC.1
MEHHHAISSMVATAPSSQDVVTSRRQAASYYLRLIAPLLLLLLPSNNLTTAFQSARQYHFRTFDAKKIRHVSSSPLFNTMPAANNNDEAAAAKKSSSPLSSPIARALLVFSIGYGLGGGASLSAWQQRRSVTADKTGVTRIALTILILREAWRFCPHWLKPRIIRFVKGLIHVLTAPFRRFVGCATTADSEAENEASSASTTDSQSSNRRQESQQDDITDLSNFITKVKQVLRVAKSKIEAEEHSSGEAYKTSEMQLSLLAYLQLLWQIKAKRANSRDELYRGAGERLVPSSSTSNNHHDLLVGADEMFELADLAYNEHVSGEDLKVVLKGMGYDLIKHDTTNPVPGYLGHYVAISGDDDDGSLVAEDNSSSSSSLLKKKKEKIAVIGIKGTSTLEDLLTDMCANSVEYTLDHPFYEGGSKTLRCHEGVYISSQRLVADLLPLVKNLLIPSGYKIVVVGHSLGAGCATIVSLLLRASIPSLRADSNKKLKVWAFASPPVLDLDSSRGCSSFVTTVVNNCDVVPRFNIGPFVVTVRLLRAMHKRLKERNLGMTDLLLKDWLKKSHKDLEEEEGCDDEKDEMLMSMEEYVLAINDAISRSDDHDPDHLYVPGKVLVLYDLWEKEQVFEEGRKESTKDYATILKEWVKHLKEEDTLRSIDEVDAKNVPVAEEAILSDGTCKALRLIEFDGRLIDDHLASSYRSSIANILSSVENTTVA